MRRREGGKGVLVGLGKGRGGRELLMRPSLFQ